MFDHLRRLGSDFLDLHARATVQQGSAGKHTVSSAEILEEISARVQRAVNQHQGNLLRRAAYEKPVRVGGINAPLWKLECRPALPQTLGTFISMDVDTLVANRLAVRLNDVVV